MTALPARMRCVEIARPGGPDVLRLAERALPVPAPGEVLVKVAAAGVNRPDVSQRKGEYPPPPGASDIPGLEIAGTVAALGPGAERWRVGDAVTALVSGGGYAEYCTAPAVQCLPVPQGLSMAEAAALPETFFTVWQNLFDRARLAAGETALIHGGTSGIGTTAIQLATAFGAIVYATAGSRAKADTCEKLGAKRGIDYKAEDFVAVVKAETGGKGSDVILDMVGGPYLARNLQALAIEGRIAQIAVLEGGEATIPLRLLLMKRASLIGSVLRARSVAEKAAVARRLEEKAWPLIAAGRVKPVMDSILPLADAAKAHARMESSAHVGKIVLTV
jgi:putative PIG3 family NAD(P)H quinone oxidoreductase